jgi:lysyl-tRNA synthetase class I
MCRLCASQAEHDQKVAAAKSIADRQRHYAMLHHQMRIVELQKNANPDWLTRELLRLSHAYVANPVEQGSSYAEHFDAAYIAELDAFGAQQKLAA